MRTKEEIESELKGAREATTKAQSAVTKLEQELDALTYEKPGRDLVATLAAGVASGDIRFKFLDRKCGSFAERINVSATFVGQDHVEYTVIATYRR